MKMAIQVSAADVHHFRRLFWAYAILGSYVFHT